MGLLEDCKVANDVISIDGDANDLTWEDAVTRPGVLFARVMVAGCLVAFSGPGFWWFFFSQVQ